MKTISRGIWVTPIIYALSLPMACSTGGTKRASTAASDEDADSEDAKKLLSKPGCAKSDSGSGASALKLEEATGTTATAKPEKTAPAQNCGTDPLTVKLDPTATGTGTGSGTTATGTGSGTTATGTGSGTVVPPPPPPPVANVLGKTLEQCNSEGKAWVPGGNSASTCGDALVTWCCSMAEIANQFPAYGSQFGQIITEKEASGFKLYNCSYAANKFTVYFVKASGGSISSSSTYMSGVAPTPKAAPTTCALPKAASLGL